MKAYSYWKQYFLKVLLKNKNFMGFVIKYKNISYQLQMMLKNLVLLTIDKK